MRKAIMHGSYALCLKIVTILFAMASILSLTVTAKPSITTTARKLSKRSQSVAFERVMTMGIQKRENTEQESLRKSKLHKALLENAVYISPSSKSNSDTPNFMKPNKGQGRQLADDGDDGNYDDNYYGYGFDISEYSLKYTQCQAISTWSDELAEDEESVSVLKTQRFALFRLCPSNTCNANNQLGCSSNYGEYILDMATYLEAMQEYTESRAQAYCDFCENCMASDDDAARRRLADDDGGGDDAAAADDAAADDAAADDAAGDDAAAAAGDDAAAQSCAYYDECYNYANTCENEDDAADDGAVVIDYEDFFECQAFEGQNGMEMYLGPHCGNDGRSIVIGIYYDDTCTQYAGKDYNINSFTGMSFDNSALSAYYANDCVSCLESELPYNQVDDDVNDQDAISEICENLYFQSAKCNQAIGDIYTSDNEAKVENMVCYYISNIVAGVYDEYGEIYLDNDGVKGYITAVIKQTSEVQVVALGAVIFTCIIFMMYAGYLHRALTYRTSGGNGEDEWAPRKGLYYGDISRQNSGIVIGRSRSSGSYNGGILA